MHMAANSAFERDFALTLITSNEVVLSQDDAYHAVLAVFDGNANPEAYRVVTAPLELSELNR